MKKVRMFKSLFTAFYLLIFVLLEAALVQAMPVSVRDSEVHYIQSKVMKERLEIDVFLPKKYQQSKKKYPVLYVTDAEYNFGAVAYIARRLIKNKDIPEIILVGIAYNDSYDGYYKKRGRDLTPYDYKLKGFPKTGEAQKFTEFIEKEVFPFIDTRYRTDKNDRSLYGHSFGGLFGYYVLFSHTKMFRRIISLSPSLWFGKRQIFKDESVFSKKTKKLSVIFYTAVGEDEKPYFVNDWKKMTNQIQSRKYQGFVFKSTLFPNENHKSIFGTAFTDGLRFIYTQH